MRLRHVALGLVAAGALAAILLQSGCGGRSDTGKGAELPGMDVQRSAMDASLRGLVGQSEEDVRARRGNPSKARQLVWSNKPMWGPGEGLGKVLREGQAYDEWTWIDGKLTIYVWFADREGGQADRSKWAAVDTFIHREGTVY